MSGASQPSGAGDRSGAEGAEDVEPKSELVDLSPPPADSPVVQLLEKTAVRHRSWFITVYLGVLITVILASILGPGFLPEQAWTQMKPEVADVRLWLFQIGFVIVGGYLFTGKASK
ncbi:hypothetical protein ACIBQ1_58535 [Nonomuraea sp. NPDC050153]|uniref:hypothetical protein n=1 Tax=Nonomuraea sp. NPDC050153 TaxID=3364359 RepID=UPI0037B112C8